MINDISIGIAQAIDGKFGDGYTIYTEDVKQGLKAPCFQITLVESSISPLLGSRKKRMQPFQIAYFPSSDTASRSEMQEVADKLYEALEYISFGDGMLRGTDMSSNIVDGVLSFFVSYNFTTIATSEKEYMQELEIKGGIKS